MRSVSESSRGQSSGKFGQLSETDRTVVAERIVALLRKIHPHKTAEAVEAAAGVPRDTVQKWLDRASAPSLVPTIQLLNAYGPDMLAAIMGDKAPAWLDRAREEQRAAQIEAQIAALQSELNTIRS